MKTYEFKIDPQAAQLGKSFRYYREAANLTLRDMAQLMRMSINPIRHHEAGIRLLRIPEIWRASSVLGVTPDRLLDPAIDPTVSQ